MIWVDLDETLVHSLERPGSKRRTPLAFEGGQLWSMARPGARELLAELRIVAARDFCEVRMLTTAKYAYARAASDAFKFGFKPAQIVAREEWLDNFARPKGHHVDYLGVLIDNASSRLAHVDKCEYLGIDARRLVLVRDYLGHPSDRLQKHWPAVVEQVREILRGSSVIDDLNAVRGDR
jgi:hypothetical protein